MYPKTGRISIAVRYCTECGHKFHKLYPEVMDLYFWESYFFMSNYIPNIKCELCGSKTAPISKEQFIKTFPLIPKEEVDRRYPMTKRPSKKQKRTEETEE